MAKFESKLQRKTRKIKHTSEIDAIEIPEGKNKKIVLTTNGFYKMCNLVKNKKLSTRV
jgi:hypothetical protein